MRRIRLGAALALALLTGTVVLVAPGNDAAAQRGSGASPAAAQPPGAIPADLAMVPADAAGFVHLRVADILKDSSFDPFRMVLAKAGVKAVSTVDGQFVPAPSSFNRATAFVTVGDKGGRKEPLPFAILSFSAPFDEAKVVAAYMPKAEKGMAAGKAVYTDKELGVAAHFPNATHIVVGMPGALEEYLAKPVTRDGPLANAIALAATKPVVAGANIAALPIPPEAINEVPPGFRPILMAQQVVVSLDLGDTSKVNLAVTYKDGTAATDAHKAVRAIADMGRRELTKAKMEFEEKLYSPKIKTPRPPEELPDAVASLFALGAMNWADEILADETLVTVKGSDLVASVALPKQLAAAGGGTLAVGVGLLLPAVQKVREAAARTQAANNLKQIMLAIHNYHDVYGHFPADIVDKNGKPLLSWRVAILPFIEQDNVFKQMKMDEPWDSETNQKMSQLTIKTYISPSAAGGNIAGMTNYRGIAGPGAAFEAGKKLKFTDFTDGTSNTVVVIETADLVEWAKPGNDFPFDPKKPLPKINYPYPGGFQVGMGDGSVRFVAATVAEATLRAMFTRNGGEVIPFNP
jgi:hypothetical protein